MSVREAQLKARIGQLLALDPQQPVLSNATLSILAREFSAAEAREDRDVLAERAACLAVLEAALGRIGVAAVTMAPVEYLAIEITRFGAAIEGVRQGLHRTSEES